MPSARIGSLFGTQHQNAALRAVPPSSGVPDDRVHGEQPLEEACPQPGGDPAAMPFEAELVLQRPDDRLNALPRAVGKRAGLALVLAARADQGKLQVGSGEEVPGLLPGQALVRDDGGAGHRAVSRLVGERLPGLLAFPVQLRVGQAEPGDGALAAADQQQLAAPVPA
jgi:hypothetical protein